MDDLISRQAAIDALHTWFRDGFDEDKWWNSTHVLAAIEGIPSAQQGYKWETCFDCPLSHGCPKIKGCTNEQANEYASQIPNDCPLSAQPDHIADIGKKAEGDMISRQAAIDALDEQIEQCNRALSSFDISLKDEYAIKVERASLKAYRELLENLPSAQPERTCVNCGRTVNNGGWYADGRTRCPIEEHYALPKDGYCHLWEKRNVTDDDYPERRTDE